MPPPRRAAEATLAAQQAAEDVLALETRLAEGSLAPAAAADPAATAHHYAFAQLQKLAPRLDWERYFADAGLPRIDLNVAEPAFLERLDRELEATPVEVWKAYLTFHLLESASPWLARPFADESFAFRDKSAGSPGWLPRPGSKRSPSYGAIGIGVAHDLTHAIDGLGAELDAAGLPRNWWTDADREAFQKLGQCVVDQYDGYAVAPGVHLQGKQVMG